MQTSFMNQKLADLGEIYAFIRDRNAKFTVSNFETKNKRAQ